MIRAVALSVLVLLLGGSEGIAQDARLARTFEGAILAALQEEVDAARSVELPTEPLVLKALEGRSKNAPDQVIVRAVRELREGLGRARSVLGPETDATTLVAAAGALRLGMEPPGLRELADAAEREVLATALVVAVDLVRRGVPVGQACDAMVSLGRAGADASTLTTLRERVDDDIRTGARADQAMDIRIRGVLARLGGGGGV